MVPGFAYVKRSMIGECFQSLQQKNMMTEAPIADSMIDGGRLIGEEIISIGQSTPTSLIRYL